MVVMLEQNVTWMHPHSTMSTCNLQVKQNDYYYRNDICITLQCPTICKIQAQAEGNDTSSNGWCLGGDYQTWKTSIQWAKYGGKLSLGKESALAVPSTSMSDNRKRRKAVQINVWENIAWVHFPHRKKCTESLPTHLIRALLSTRTVNSLA